MLRQPFAALQGVGQMSNRKFFALARPGWPSLNRSHGGYLFRMDFI